jgi:hypothetical protein
MSFYVNAIIDVLIYQKYENLGTTSIEIGAGKMVLIDQIIWQ